MANEAKQVNRVKVNINGEDYYIKGTVPEEYHQASCQIRG